MNIDMLQTGCIVFQFFLIAIAIARPKMTMKGIVHELNELQLKR